MPPLRIYLDTSVPGGVFDAEFEKDTAVLLRELRQGDVRAVVSEQVETELELAPHVVQALLRELYNLGAERLEGFNSPFTADRSVVASQKIAYSKPSVVDLRNP